MPIDEKLDKELNDKYLLITKSKWITWLGGFTAAFIAAFAISYQTAISTAKNYLEKEVGKKAQKQIDESIAKTQVVLAKAESTAKALETLHASNKKIFSPAVEIIDEKEFKLGLRGNASSYVVVPYNYQGRWLIRVFHLDEIASNKGRIEGQTVKTEETGFTVEKVDYLICIPAMDVDRVIVKACRFRK